jgi:hypothetical protein
LKDLVHVKLTGRALGGELFIVGILAACTEQLSTNVGCPDLCTDQAGGIETVTIDPVVLDTTVSGLLGVGTEAQMLMSNRGDTVDSRVVIRFDSIPARYNKVASDTTTTAISLADSARLRIRIDTTGAKFPGPITIDAYDVDTDAPDSVTSAVAALFIPSRLITSQTFAVADLKDTVDIQLPQAAILAKLGQRMRIGLRARSDAGSVQFRINSVEAGLPEQLYFRVDKDTAIKAINLNPYSTTPADQSLIASSLSDYTLVAKAPPTPPVGVLNVGGLPAQRVYMRFNIPPFLADSAQLVRVSLLLTQRPDVAIDAKDTMRIVAHVSLAAQAITDVSRAALITAQTTLDTLKVLPGDSGVKVVEIGPIVGVWRTQTLANTPRAIVLVSSTEGGAPIRAQFFSIEASPDLRPKLRFSYSTRKTRGLP